VPPCGMLWDRRIVVARPASSTDAVRRAGRTAAFLYALGAVYMLATAGQLPAAAADRIWLAALIAGLTSLTLLVLPWGRLPSWTSLLPPLWAFVILFWPIGLYAQALSHYLILYTLLFLYVGLTQRRGTAVAMLPLALLSLLPVRDEPALLPPLFLLGPVLVAALLGELIAALLAQQRRGQQSLAALLAATAELQAAVSTRDAADVIARMCCTSLRADSVAVLLREEPGSTRLVNVNTAHAAVPPGQLVVDVSSGTSGIRAALDTGGVVFSADAATDPRLDQRVVSTLAATSVLFVPLGAHMSFEGAAVAVFHRRRRGVEASAQRAAEVLATQAGQVLRRVRESLALQDLAATDPLTGLPNRRTFFSRLVGLDPGDCLVFLDLDHFKQINDTRGHQAGDAVLRSFAVALSAAVRAEDVCGRYGGEEFALLLPQTSAEEAQRLLDRFRRRWRVEMPGVSFSAGIAVHARRSPTETLAAADAALYEAKAAGRDCDRVAPAVAADADGVAYLDRRRRSSG
jgi:diguanylate cyclase (GGDEF)-like protein